MMDQNGTVCPSVFLAALAVRAFARFSTSAALRAEDNLGAAFFATAGAIFFAAAFFSRHRFFKAATIAALPALLSLRFGSGVAGAGGSDSPLILAHLAFCAIAILRRDAAENFFRFLTGASGVAAFSAGPPGSMARSSAILVSMLVFWNSKPSMAAVMISFVSFGVGM